jgi:NCAIR mutase (PurE)-related protein
MKSSKIEEILKESSEGHLSVKKALEEINTLFFEDIGHAKIDHHRASRTGVPEAIFAPGKTDRQIMQIFQRMFKAGSPILVTRAEKSTYAKLKKKYRAVKYNETAKMITMTSSRIKTSPDKTIAVVTGGTSDMPVAEEAAVTIEAFGGTVERIYDVGVAGIHRLLSHRENLRKASAVIVAAGMEGALASVVGGLVAAPVIAVPTSIGYGASFGGIAALLAMLNSCAPGVVVVNIDNGLGRPWRR